jgi:hypothetical protein
MIRIKKPDQAPNTKYLKSFFKCLIREGKGLITEKISVQTLLQYASAFATAYKRKHNVSIEEIITPFRDVSFFKTPFPKL